jgi:hypothetical protein
MKDILVKYSPAEFHLFNALQANRQDVHAVIVHVPLF